jgi:hypothetical protein
MAVFECRPWLGSFSGVGGAWKQLYDKTNPREDPQYTKDVLDWTKVRKTHRCGPEVGPTAAFYCCTPTGMRGPTCISWASLTHLSRSKRATKAIHGVGLPSHGP